MTNKPSATSLLGIAGKPFAKLLGVLIVLVLAHLSGRVYQHFHNGYAYTENEVTTFPHKDGLIALKHVRESVGFQLWGANMSLLELQPIGKENIMIYRSRIGIQEPDNAASNVRVDGRSIHWEDLFYRYSLHLEPVEETGSEHASDGNAVRPAGDERTP